jgi:hypothetical protein
MGDTAGHSTAPDTRWPFEIAATTAAMSRAASIRMIDHNPVGRAHRAERETARLDEIMKEKIDELVAAFSPEMQRIQSLKESDVNKIRVSENWLRARLEKFAGDVRQDCERKSRAPG